METIEKVYDKIAHEFDKTRVFPWTHVKKYIDDLEKDSLVLDIGCGNGKNLFYRKDISCVGIDISQKMVDLVISRDGLASKASMTKIPFVDNMFDNFICIAAYHHLDNDKDRKTALNEMYRILKYKGTGLISVWAKEQPKGSKLVFNVRDNIVPWNSRDGQIYYRYYHIYNEGMLKEEITRLEPRLEVQYIIYERGNWYIQVRKE